MYLFFQVRSIFLIQHFDSLRIDWPRDLKFLNRDDAFSHARRITFSSSCFRFVLLKQRHTYLCADLKEERERRQLESKPRSVQALYLP
jgi:hypothetical protein